MNDPSLQKILQEKLDFLSVEEAKASDAEEKFSLKQRIDETRGKLHEIESLPKLPELDPKEVNAMRSFLPGKLLGRTAALLSLVLLFIAFVKLTDNQLRGLLPTELPLSLPYYYALLIGLPLMAVVAQVIVEFRAKRNRRLLQALAVQTGVEQSGYFRIGPYLDTAEDRAKFSRADRAQERVLDWIERSDLLPLYLTGDSGSGKTSLLNAFVLPALRKRGWDVIETRAWQDPEEALRTSLAKLAGARTVIGENTELVDVIAAAAQRAGTRLLLVLDQFEEFIILAKSERQQKFQALIAELRSRQIKNLTLLLILRSDYQAFLGDLGLPPLRQGENFFPVGRFTLSAGSDFMKQSQLGLQPDALDHLLTSTAELDETPGLVRPITLNIIGYVLASGRTVAPSLDAGLLVRRYIEQTINQPAIRDFAPPILEQLITEQGTKQPRSEPELAKEAGCRPGEVRAVLTGLGAAALARPLDPGQGIWELSHDFVARAVTRYLGRQRGNLLRRSSAYAAPALLAVMLLAVISVFAWDRLRSDQLQSELKGLGITVISKAGEQSVSVPSDITEADWAKANPLIARLQRVVKLDLAQTRLPNLESLKGLTALLELDLSDTEVANLEPLRGLSALQTLKLPRTQVINLEPLNGLTALKALDLTSTKVVDFKPLRGLTKLQELSLWLTNITGLEPLNGLTKLQTLNLWLTNVTDLAPLKGLTDLQTLILSGTQVINLEPLKDLTKLQMLALSDTPVANLEPLIGLTELQILNPANTNIANLEPLKGLTKLRMLQLAGTKVVELEPLSGLTALQVLDLSRTQVADLQPLSGLTKLQALDLSRTQVADLQPLSGLTKLQTFGLQDTKVTDLAPVQNLNLSIIGLQTLPREEVTRYLSYRNQHDRP